jgi:hypothetical protein
LNKRKILKAIFELKNPYPRQIKDLLDKQARQTIERQNKNSILTSKERKSRIKKETMSMRTVLYWLTTLTKEGSLNHENNRYSLSNKAILSQHYCLDLAY